jgi:hypothetical protein
MVRGGEVSFWPVSAGTDSKFVSWPQLDAWNAPCRNAELLTPFRRIGAVSSCRGMSLSNLFCKEARMARKTAHQT